MEGLQEVSSEWIPRLIWNMHVCVRYLTYTVRVGTHTRTSHTPPVYVSHILFDHENTHLCSCKLCESNCKVHWVRVSPSLFIKFYIKYFE
jgi:hypothetical protein